MGINNLLKYMKPYVEPIHMKKYAGKRVGIDAYSWLHKGAYSCSMELSLDIEGDKKYQFLNYFMHRINMLRHYKITPVVVFDGGSIPCKAATEDERHRHANRDMAMEKLKNGDANAASELFQDTSSFGDEFLLQNFDMRAVTVTPLMAHQLIQILRSEKIEFVVAPYEADAQLAYLSGLEAEKGGIVAVISEDSDLLAYGCPAVVFKMDRYGNGEEIVLEKVFNAVGGVPSFKKFDGQLFIGMCVLAGCDFLPSVPGVGIAKAYNYVAKYLNIDRVISVLKFEKGKQVPEDYPKTFKEAMIVFQHARVYDKVSKQLKPLKPFPPELLQCQNEELDFLGPDIPSSLAIAIAEGNLDPCTMEAFNHYPECGDQYRLSLPHSVNGLMRQEETTESMQEGCFAIVSCHKTSKKRIQGDMPPYATTNSSGKGKPKTITQEVLHPRETLALEKLVFPFRNEASTENKKVSIGFASNIPNNNPFKKRKQNEVQLINQTVVDEQASQVTPESQESVDSKLANSTYPKITNKTYDSSRFIMLVENIHDVVIIDVIKTSSMNDMLLITTWLLQMSRGDLLGCDCEAKNRNVNEMGQVGSGIKDPNPPRL
ncbi:hypothetical protein DH2020_043187 [Rehmannia glutinosa]|uniref:Exonuclease 1 n=1 Tax=Rehmannia glutinosa TaxID=99300 RepID=A0ABR0UKB5_REHGL